MHLATGAVIGGKIVVAGDPLPDGWVVAILAREADETFDVPAELEAELRESIAQADRGDRAGAVAATGRLFCSPRIGCAGHRDLARLTTAQTYTARLLASARPFPVERPGRLHHRIAHTEEE